VFKDMNRDRMLLPVNLKDIAAKITHWMNRRPPGTCASDFH
jgi:hypothetical protein